METRTGCTQLKIRRMQAGIKAWRVAYEAGISSSLYSLFETGRRRCPADLRHKIAKVLEASVDEIFPAGFDEEAERLRKHGDVW